MLSFLTMKTVLLLICFGLVAHSDSEFELVNEPSPDVGTLPSVASTGKNKQQSKVHKSVDYVRSAGVRLLPASTLAPLITLNRNLTDDLVEVIGYLPDVCHLVAQRFNLNYSWVPVSKSVQTVDDLPNKRGLISFIKEGEGDVIVGAMVLTMERFRHVDFTMAILDGGWDIMLPYPTTTSFNSKAIVKPFTIEVWIGLLLSILLIVLTMSLTLYLWDKIMRKQYLIEKTTSFNKPCLPQKEKSFINYGPLEYVVTVLLNQGNYCAQYGTASFRLMAGAWCLSAFVLIQAYSGILTSFILTPVQTPVISSIWDIPNVPHLKISTYRGLGFDVLISKFNDSSTSFGRLLISLKKDMFRCNSTEQCLAGVRSGNNVYFNSEMSLDGGIYDNYKSSGTCEFTRLQRLFWYGTYSFGTAKNSDYLIVFNKGILDLEAAGMLKYLQRKYFIKPVRCLDVKTQRALRDQKKSISLSEFRSTFILLGIGCLLAFAAFVCEVLLRRFKN